MTTPVADLADPVAASATRLRATGCAPRIAVVLGSGWGGLTQRVEGAVEVPYAELPAFPRPSVGGHAARVVLGRIGPHEVALLAGRQHPYEGGRADGMNGALRTLAALGVQTLVLTNAAGSLDPALPPGGLMLISDHLNLPQLSPLWEERDDRRFVDMTDAYAPALRARARAAASRVGMELHEGVYAWVIGPQFETPAEIRMLRTLGAQQTGGRRKPGEPVPTAQDDTVLSCGDPGGEGRAAEPPALATVAVDGRPQRGRHLHRDGPAIAGAPYDIRHAVSLESQGVQDRPRGAASVDQDRASAPCCQ
jgi:purine-nucleoside phosphorylase